MTLQRVRALEARERRTERGLELEGALDLFDGLVVPASHQINPSDIRIRKRGERIKALGELNLVYAFAESPHRNEKPGVVVMGHPEAGIDLERALKIALGFLPLPFISKLDRPARNVRIRALRIKLDRPQCRLHRFRVSLRRQHHIKHSEQPI